MLKELILNGFHHTYIHRIPELIWSKHFVALKFKKTTDAKG